MTFPISLDNIWPLVTVYEFSQKNQYQNTSVGNGSKHFFHKRFHNEMVRRKYHGMRNISFVIIKSDAYSKQMLFIVQVTTSNQDLYQGKLIHITQVLLLILSRIYRYTSIMTSK